MELMMAMVAAVSGDAGVDDRVKDVEGISRVWSGRSSKSCRGGEGRLEATWASMTFGLLRSS
jgi:hypothetical protein